MTFKFAVNFQECYSIHLPINLSFLTAHKMLFRLVALFYILTRHCNIGLPIMVYHPKISAYKPNFT